MDVSRTSEVCAGSPGGASPLTPRMPLMVIAERGQQAENGLRTPLTPLPGLPQQSMTPKSKQKMASMEAANERLQQVTHSATLACLGGGGGGGFMPD